MSLREVLLIAVLVVCGSCESEWRSDANAAAALNLFVSAQEDFRDNDKDGDGIANYWVSDVAGLYGVNRGGVPLQLIDVSLARADRTPGRPDYSVVGEFEAHVGYAYAALERYSVNGAKLPYDEGKGRNASRYGIVAFPSKEGVDDDAVGSLTFIVNEKGAIYSKNTRGKPVWVFPENPQSEGWEPFDFSP